MSPCLNSVARNWNFPQSLLMLTDPLGDARCPARWWPSSSWQLPFRLVREITRAAVLWPCSMRRSFKRSRLNIAL